MFTFDGFLRFHAYTPTPGERYGSFAVRGESTEVRLTIGPATPTIEYAPPPGGLQSREWIGSVSTHAQDDRVFVSVFSTGTSSVLTWQCLGDEPGLIFTATRHLDGAPEISATMGSGEGRSYGTWRLIQHLSDAAIAPPAVVEAFTEAARRSSSLLLRASTEEDVPQGHAFGVRGLDQALEKLPCWSRRPVPRTGAAGPDA